MDAQATIHRQRAEHISADANHDGVPDELVDRLAQCRALRLYCEQNEHTFGLAATAWTIAVDLAERVTAEIEGYRSAHATRQQIEANRRAAEQADTQQLEDEQA